MHFIRYLEPMHYFGIDRRKRLLDVGREVKLPLHNLVEKRPTLVQMEDFGFERLGQKFQFALAQSVFTHLPINKMIPCLMNI